MAVYSRCCLALLLLVLSASGAQAQLITDATRALAARDTLFQQAQQLRQLAQQKSVYFTTKTPTRYKRREVASGGETQPTGPRETRFTWRQITRYRRNGRVQQWFSASVGKAKLFEEYRLNGRTLWLLFPQGIAGSNGRLPRHIGRYYASGFVVLDNDRYVLPSAPQ